MISLFVKQAPFSHNPGTLCLVPGADIVVRAFPSYFVVETLEGELVTEQDCHVSGLVKNFTIMQDLKKGCVTVFSDQYRFHVLPNKTILKAKNPSLPKPKNQEILFLGSSKTQDWDLILRRQNLQEIFPLWFRLGTFFQEDVVGPVEGATFSLLKECQQLVANHSSSQITPAFTKLFLAAFSDMLIPYTNEKNGWGILPKNLDLTKIAVPLLKQSSLLIRSLFLTHDADTISILPTLSPDFDSGRMMNIEIPLMGSIDIEWTKKLIRRITFRSVVSKKIQFIFSPEIARYRFSIKKTSAQKIMNKENSIEVSPNEIYYFDRFEK
ncbi:Uncharacterized protein CLAVI_000016 [Candidatus Clavichlamydia salmonicola]|uniref:hypothetical protein n=1 Tax=Candidatus Clavichlamydia salmonicola TaxID=469812 RepID=UPI001890D8FD|nr:hypothetical protein [Candidatus Clavichlamydia salmonicola]MBF5050415.1 Uncharacterized protein [Candidatus Clavichlamydia salmonicola]